MNSILLAVNTILYLVLFIPLTHQLVQEWMDNPYYSHGFAIPLIAGFFLWRKREELKNVSLTSSVWGIFIVLMGASFFVLAKLGYQFFMQCSAMVVVLFGLVLVHAGWSMAKKTAFSIFYLFFMIPMPQLVYTNLTFRLRLFSTKLSFFVIKLLGINATREGNIINLPTAVLVVANPCSGLRGLITFIVGSLAIGYIFQKSIWKRVILLCFSVLLAVLMNIARLVTLAVVADINKMDHISKGMDDIAGLLLLVIGLGILFMFNDFLSRLNKK